MTTLLTKPVEAVLNFSLVSRLRRNHGLEHATLNVLAQRHPGVAMAGHSDLGGFWILGDISALEVEAAVGEALRRMLGGEQRLAVHANCGTNYVTAGVLAGLSAWAAMFGAGRRWQDKVERLPLAISAAMLAIMVAQPLGLLMQERYTTAGNPEGLQVVKIVASKQGTWSAYRVITRG